MSVRVIEERPDPSVVKRIVCKNCGATLEYTPIDEKRDHTTDYTGGRDYYNYINCPRCGHEVKTRDY